MKGETGNHVSGQSGMISTAIRDRIVQALEGIRFGAVEIVIHDGRVVQIERKERVRFEK
jgi:hypothetical protein